MVNIFVYGSLRPGYYNWDRFELHKYADILRSGHVMHGVALKRMHAKIGGKQQYLGYPAMFRHPTGTVVGDLIRIHNELVAQEVFMMEVGAGYTPYTIMINEFPAVVFMASDVHKTHRDVFNDTSIPFISEFPKE